MAASKYRQKYQGPHLKTGSMDMRVNNGKNPENTGQPDPETSFQQWEMFKRICTVAHGDPEAILKICYLMGLSKHDLVKLKIYRRRARMFHRTE